MQLSHVLRASLMVAAFATLASCADEKIVYKDVGRFDPLPANAGGFLGFAKAGDQQQTVCGTCHQGRQQDWLGTKHSTAWADLQASGHATAACEGCHTVGPNGNGAATNTGWNATKDARYQNVQCESCHGPGEAHVLNPTSANVPLVTANQVTDPKATDGCGACHQGEHHPFLEEWEQSPHGEMEFTYEDAAEAKSIIENDATTGAEKECSGCHTGDRALARDMSSKFIGFRAGVTRGYKEAGRVQTVNNAMKITCLVCHDPHKNGNPAQLRFSISSTDTLGNLCVRCHNRRPGGATSPSSFRGPHSAEGALFFGENAGYRFPSMPALPARITGTHQDTKANPKQCVTCHMASYAVTDAAGKSLGNTTGHLFNGFPCKDASGKLVGGSCSLDQRSFKGCVGSGCHSSETSAKSVFMNTEGRVEFLLEDLKELLENTAKVSCSEYVYSGKPVTVARGARYNYLLATGHGAMAVDECSALSKGETIRSLPAPIPAEGAVAHNPAYLEQLLRSSIAAVKATYYK
jgi:predicted CXXCH cytochrome family protein